MARKKKHMVCKCGMDKEVVFTGETVQYPTFSCPECGPDKRNEWEIWWNAYKDLWKDIEKWDRIADATSCVIGYFCYYYDQFYGIPYVFAYNSAKPYTDKDFMQAKRLIGIFQQMMVSRKDMEIKLRDIKAYIRWVFAKIIKTPKYEIHSFGFFTDPKFVNRFLHAKKRARRITRFSKLPQDFVKWCEENAGEIFDSQELETWNDLNGIVSVVKSYGKDGSEWIVAQEAIRRGMLPPGPEFRRLEE